MKKFLSVILSVVMLLSCLAVLAVSAGAETTYPNEKNQKMYDWYFNTVALHRISDSFYVDQNCFVSYGAIRYYDSFDSAKCVMTYDWSWQVNTTTGSEDDFDIGNAYISNSPLYVYVNTPISYTVTGTVTDILVIHSVYDEDHYITASTLTSEYSNN